MMQGDYLDKLEQLRSLFTEIDRALIAYSGGIDSTLVAKVAFDVLGVEGEYYSFSSCHRYEACTRLGHDMILCRVRRAPRSVLQRHLA